MTKENEDEAIKSVSAEKAKIEGLNISDGRGVYLCKTHYKQLKKNLRKEKLIEKWRHMR